MQITQLHSTEIVVVSSIDANPHHHPQKKSLVQFEYFSFGFLFLFLQFHFSPYMK
jgi:hypothetical protein